MEINITQDLRKFKTKDVGALSFKEAGFVAVGAGLGFLTYKVLGSLNYALIPVGIVLAFGFLKPMGLSLFQFIKTAGKELTSPKFYINQTDFVYEPDEFDELYGEEIAIPPCWNDVIQTQESSAQGTIDKVEKDRFAT